MWVVDWKVKGLLAIALVSWWTLAHRADATRRAQDAAEATLAQAVAAETARAVDLTRAARDRADRLESEMADVEERYRDLLEALENSSSGCSVGPDIRERLRAIR